VTTWRRSLPWRAWLLAALAALGTACYPAHVGFRPHAERLPELRVGASTKGDVEALLGEPLGHGAARFAPELAAGDLWVYGYEGYDGGLPRVERWILLVFFAGDRYDGHLWTANRQPPRRPAEKSRP
jgi:hypothetical protein